MSDREIRDITSLTATWPPDEEESLESVIPLFQIEYARKRNAAKRNCGQRVTLDSKLPLAQEKEIDFEALRRLAELDARQAQIVELRFFGGLSIEESAEVLGISPATVKRDWLTARVWLHKELAIDRQGMKRVRVER